MTRWKLEAARAATAASVALLETVHAEVEPQLEAMRKADALLDAVRGRPQGSDKGGPVDAATLLKYGPERYTLHSPETQDGGGME